MINFTAPSGERILRLEEPLCSRRTVGEASHQAVITRLMQDIARLMEQWIRIDPNQFHRWGDLALTMHQRQEARVGAVAHRANRNSNRRGIMKRPCQMLILLVAMVTSIGRAEDSAFCKSMCDSERRQCRGMAETLSRTDTAPILSMGKNPYVRQAEQWQKISPEAWAQNDYRNRRFERIRNCEDRFMRCTSSCSDPSSASSTGSVVINPKKED